MKCSEFVFALVFLLGLVLAGSDGAWFPWPNLAGVALFACLLLAKVFLDERPAPWRQ
jgi:hypothetical protein